MRTLLVACTLVALAVSAQDLVPVSHPQLDSVEAVVRNDLLGARAELEALQEGDADADEIGAAWGELGELYLVYDLSEAAAACLENASTLLPEQSRWPYLLGTLYQVDGRNEDAARWYRQARALDPAYVPTLIRLGRVEMALGEMEEARRVFEAALLFDPSSAAAHGGLARLATREGDLDAAVLAYLRALELQPEATALNYALAQVYRQQGDLEAARRHLELRGAQQVQFVDPIAYEVKQKASGSAAQVFLANQSLKEGSAQAAIRELREALVSNPGSLAVLSGLAKVLESEGRLEEAIGYQRQAVELHPESTRNRARLGEMLVRAGRDSEAVEQLEVVVEQAPDLDLARIQLADALGRLGRFAQAKPHADRLVEDFPDSVDLRWKRLRIDDRLGNLDAVRSDLEILLIEAPTMAGVHFRWGMMVLAEGNQGEALVRFQRAAELDPDLEEAWTNAAILLGREGRYREAAAAQAQVVRLEPGNPDAHLMLATARILGEEYALARQELLRALERHRDDPRIADVLARLLAAAPDDAVRDGAMAVEVASKVLKVYPRAEYAQTLAMALAEVGDFEQALALQQRVVEEFRERGSEAEAALRQAERWRESYRQGRPLRSPWLG